MSRARGFGVIAFVILVAVIAAAGLGAYVALRGSAPATSTAQTGTPFSASVPAQPAPASVQQNTDQQSGSSYIYKPDCSITANTTTHTPKTFSGADTLYVEPNAQVDITWSSDHASSTSMTTDAGIASAVSTSGHVALTPSQNDHVTFAFWGAAGFANCEVDLVMVNMNYDRASLTASTARPTITGTASGMSTIKFTITPQTSPTFTPLYDSGFVPVTGGKWRFTPNIDLADGVYMVTAFAPDESALYTGTLTVSSGGAGAFSITPVTQPGNVNLGPNDDAPVAKIQLTNTGSGLASLEGFHVQFFGTASPRVIVGLGARAETSSAGLTGGVEGYSPFDNGSVTEVPLRDTLQPGETKIYYIVAAVSSQKAPVEAGKSFQIAIDDIDTTLPISGNLPVYGANDTVSAQ